MFKNFQQFNQDQSRAIPPALAELLKGALSTQDAFQSTVANAAQDYTDSYNKVQMLKYDDEGNPVDITPAAQITVPNNILARARARATSIKERLERQVQTLGASARNLGLPDIIASSDISQQVVVLAGRQIIVNFDDLTSDFTASNFTDIIPFGMSRASPANAWVCAPTHVVNLKLGDSGDQATFTHLLYNFPRCVSAPVFAGVHRASLTPTQLDVNRAFAVWFSQAVDGKQCYLIVAGDSEDTQLPGPDWDIRKSSRLGNGFFIIRDGNSMVFTSFGRSVQSQTFALTVSSYEWNSAQDFYGLYQTLCSTASITPISYTLVTAENHGDTAVRESSAPGINLSQPGATSNPQVPLSTSSVTNDEYISINDMFLSQSDCQTIIESLSEPV